MKTKNPNSYSIAILCIAVLLMFSCQSRTHQSQTITEYSNRDFKEMKMLYFYPSTIRMVSKILGDEKGLALREIQRGRLLFSLGGDIQSTRDTFKSLKSGVQTEGFEMLMEVRSSGNKIEIYMMEGEIDDYVLFVSGNEGNFILEILGNLSANAIRDISQLDMNVLADIFQDEKVKTDANEMQNP